MKLKHLKLDKTKASKEPIKVLVQWHDKFTWKKNKPDAKMWFYAGIASVALFNTIFILIRMYIPHITYWKWSKHAMQILKRTGRKKMPISFNPHDEFALTLMRLMGLWNEHIADRFDISPAKFSFIFTIWIKVLSKLLKNLVVLLHREAIWDNSPEVLIKTGNTKCRVILDCAEVFIERPKP